MKYLGLIILFIFPALIRSQEVQFTAEAAPSVVRVGEQFNLVFTSNEEFSDINLPEISGARFLGGPSTSQSQSVSAVNGKITSVSTFQYAYFFRAEKEGKFIIPAVTARIKGKVYSSNPVTIEVVKSQSQGTSQGTGTGTARGTGSTAPGENDLFVRVIPDKTEAYIGEQIMATFKVYTRQPNLAGIDHNFKGPDFTGFFTEVIQTPQPRSLQRETFNNDIYYTAVIRRMMIIPQKSGELIIDPFEVDAAIRREVRRRISNDPFFDDFVIPDIQDVPVKLKSRQVKINVKSLPPNAPASFNGAVGNFKLKTSISNNSTTTNDPLTLKVAVTGKGNLKLINDVTVIVPYDFEKFDPVINTKFDNPLSGTKTFEYLIMPRIAGNFTIPPVEFTYFDTEAGQYKTLRSESYDIAVAKGEGDSLMVRVPGTNKEDVRLLNSDIRFIETRIPNLKPVNQFIAASPWYYLSYLLAIAVFAAGLALRKRIIKQNADITGVRFRKADKYARKRLKKSETLLKQGNDAAFYEEMLGAIWGYLSYKLGIPVSSLSKENARAALDERGIEAELSDRLFRITEICEMARYGFGSSASTPQQLYHDAVKVITSLQRAIG